MGRFRGDLPARGFEFAKSIVRLTDKLPANNKGWILGKQLLRSGTSIGANLCEAEEALTDSEFTHRCSISRKEASETRYWLRLCAECGLLTDEDVEPAAREAHELLLILSAIVRKTQEYLQK